MAFSTSSFSVARRLLAAASLCGLAASSSAAPACSVQAQPFGVLSGGEQVSAWTIRNGQLAATVLDYGGILYAIEAPDRHGVVRNVVRTLEGLPQYEGYPSFSRIVGRYAGRIDGGGFTLDGERHALATRPDGVSVHGGPRGFGTRMWKAQAAACGVDLSLVSPHGDNGFPGELRVAARFRLEGADLRIEYSASTDRPTVANLTHHAFFNLSDAPTVDGHTLTVHASHYLPTNARRVPTGAIAPVHGALDLRRGRPVGAVAGATEDEIRNNKGLDHTFVLDARHAATLADPASGRVLEVFTTEPGLVVFSGNGFNGSLRDAGGRPLPKGAGLALETQHYPNSPNIAAFPSTVVRPGAPLRSTTVFRFRTEPAGTRLP